MFLAVGGIDIPSEMQDLAAEWRDKLLEALYDHSTELMDLALAEQPIPEELLHRVIREAAASGRMVSLLHLIIAATAKVLPISA